MVLAAQQWVNATYKNVPGYNVIPENGNTGWTTMYALIRALQHELGITSLTDNFGPTTLSLLTAHGNIGAGETNTNIVKIAQCGFYCKGYQPGGIDGNFGAVTVNATQEMMQDMGLAVGSVALTPKAFKSLLTMDAYVVLSGGLDSVRSCQQWLNSRYTTRANFFVIPCDGIFSRSVQTALTMAIQFELGQSDAAADGLFGPNTKAGLQGHLLSEGSSGIWVQLFTAAMIFNRIETGGTSNNIFSTFTANFDGTVSQAVLAFQSFSALSRTGTGDIETWAQLLVSYGDQSRPYSAADFITTVTPARAASLKAAGVTIVGRYLDENPNAKPYLNKKIQPGELDTIFGNGLRVFPLSQYDGQSLSYFSWSQGYDDAQKAHDAAVGYGFDTGTVIYFACDYDATQADIDSNIVPYFQGVVAGLATKGKKYAHGVYSTRNVCSEVTRQTDARWSFVSDMSSGYSGNMGFTLPQNWAFNQIQTVTLGSGDGAIQIDKDVHRSGTDSGVSSVNNPGSPVDSFVSYIANIYNTALGYHGTVNPGEDLNQLVLQFLRSPKYNTSKWTALIGGVNQDFLDYMSGQGVTAVQEMVEPFYKLAIHVDHWAAACDGMYYDPPATGAKTNHCDVAGWAGDWMSFYAEWRRDSDSYASGSAYCAAKLAKIDVNNTFQLRDLIEDADGYNIAELMVDGATLPQAVAGYYQGTGYLSRMRGFVNGRFGSIDKCKSLARDALLTTDDPLIAAGRDVIIEGTAPGVALPGLLPGATLDDFCQGFADMLSGQISHEGAARTPARS